MWELLEALGRRRELILSVLKAAIHPTHLRLLYNTIKIQKYKYTKIYRYKYNDTLYSTSPLIIFLLSAAKYNTEVVLLSYIFTTALQICTAELLCV